MAFSYVAIFNGKGDDGMSGTLKSVVKRPCKCGHNRWRTVGNEDYVDITKYACRACGAVRNVKRKEVVDNQ